MSSSPSSVNNKNNSTSKVNVNVTSQNSPFPGARHSSHEDPYSYNPPDFMKQMISSVLTFKDDIPNLLRKVAYTLITCLLISNVALLGFMYTSFNDMKSEIRDNRTKITTVYNKLREVAKVVSVTSVNSSLSE